MKPLLPHHPSSSIILSFFCFTLLMISIINIPTCLCEDDTQYTNCNTAFTCEKNISNLKYPFWGENRPEYCGSVDDPNTKLTCDGSVPMITISNIKYRIHDWDNTTQKLTVARDDYSSGDVCDFNDNSKSSTFDHTQFQQYAGVSNLTLLYGCSLATGYPANLYRYDCSDIAQLVSGNGNGIEEALKDGFDLKWAGNYGLCQACVGTGGVCGNDGGSEFRCLCKDGPHTTSCLSEKVSSLSSNRNLGLVIGVSAAGFGAIVFIIIMISCRLKRGTRRQQMSIFKQQQSGLIPQNMFRESRKLVDDNVEDLEQGNTLSNCLTISEEENDMVRKITLVSLWCIQTNPSDRPPMNKVIEMLLGPLSSVSYPPKPVLFSPERQPLQVSDMSSSDLYETNSIALSK
ncbi:non-specific serine/threonine protein kinase [Trifolium repens]|nr:non-specific serine/threonine protein kinase [Trifolium repens]